MNNQEFLGKIKEAFDMFLVTGSNSNAKLKILHGAIAKDLQNRLGENYKVHSLGFGDGKEVKMTGKYMNKNVDIAIERDGEIILAVALKFIMQNYSQNSNNYFENMLGETANIRMTDKPYCQIVILPSKVPYYKDGGELKKVEVIQEHHIEKYIEISNDDIGISYHTPNKTLFYLIDLPTIPNTVKNKTEYKEYYINNNDFIITTSENDYDFGELFIYNNYEEFINVLCTAIMNMYNY